jgi:hypothetical protein
MIHRIGQLQLLRTGLTRGVTLILFATLLTSVSSKASVSVTLSGAAGLDLDVDVELNIDTVLTPTGTRTRLRIPNGSISDTPGDPALPYLMIPLVVPPEGGVRAMIVSRSDTSALVGTVVLAESERIISDKGVTVVEDTDTPSAVAPGEISVEIMGISRGVRMARLIVRPVRVDGDRAAWTRSMKIAVRFTSPPTRLSRPALHSAASASSHPAGFAVNSDQIDAFHIPKPSGAARPASTALPDILRQPRFQLYIARSGIYRITGENLARWARDADIDITDVDPSTIRLWDRGREMRLHVENGRLGLIDDRTSIEFYATPNTGRYLDQAPDVYQDPFFEPRVLWLTWGTQPGARLHEEDAAVRQVVAAHIIAAETYRQTLHFERGNSFYEANEIETIADRYYWASLSPRQEEIFDVEIEAPALGGNPTLRVMARGGSAKTHFADFRLNGTGILTLGAQGEFSDEDLIYGESQPNTDAELVKGTNTVNAIAGAPGSTDFDRISLNWFEIDYDRYYQTSKDYIEFQKPELPDTGTFTFTVSGFTTSEVSLYKVGTSRLVNYRASQSANVDEHGFEIQFQDQIDGDNPLYVAVTDDQKLQPLQVEYFAPHTVSVRDISYQADYVIISHDALIDTAQQLADYRASAEGGAHSVALINAQQIYDEFDWGYATADALMEFVRYIYDTWPNPPRYLVFIGDGVDRFNESRIGSGIALLPIPQVAIYRWGVGGSDHLFSLHSGNDLLPDLFVGRIPATGNTGLATAIRKTIRFEQSPELTEWRKTVTLVSDLGQAFVSQAETIAENIPPRYVVKKLYSSNWDDSRGPFPMFEGDRAMFLRLANESALWTIFVGHAGGGVWGSNTLLQPTDPKLELTNAGRTGIFLSMTCFTGAYEWPGNKSLSETMLFVDGGAVAWFGATGVGWYLNDFFLTQSVVRTGIRSNRSSYEIGEALSAGKTDYLLRYGVAGLDPTNFPQALVHEFNLVGDPGLRIRPPSPSLSLSPTTHTPVYGQNVTITGTLDEPISGTAHLSLYSDNHFPHVEISDLSVTNGTFEKLLSIPDSVDLIMPDGEAATGLTLKGYVSSPANDGMDWTGHIRLAVTESLIDSVQIFGPSRDSLHVGATIRDADGVDTVSCIVEIYASNIADVVGMIRIDDHDRYQTIRPLDLSGLSATDGQAVVQTSIQVTDTRGSVTTRSDIPPIYPNRVSQVIITKVTLDGTDAPELAVTVANDGTASSDSSIVFVYHRESDGRLALIGEHRGTPLAPQLDPGTVSNESVINGIAVVTQTGPIQSSNDEAILLYPQAVTLRIPIPAELVRGGVPEVELVAKAGSIGSDTTDDQSFAVPNSWGAFVPGTSEPMQLRTGIGGHIAVFSPDALSTPAVVIVSETDLPERIGQPDLTALGPTMLGIKWRNDAKLSPSGGLTVTFVPDTTDETIRTARDDGRLRIGLWDEECAQWQVLGTARHRWSTNLDSLSAEVPSSGYYAPVIVHDDEAPTIEVSVGGQHFGEGAFVDQGSPFLVLVEDRNGISTRTGDLIVLVDNTPLADSSIVVPRDGTSPTAVAVTVMPPDFLPRKDPYELRIVAHDAAGNVAEYGSSFRIAEPHGELLDFLGTFPNPFGADGTVIAFDLSTQMKHVQVRIYDLAGRLVLKFDNFDLTQLHPDETTEANIDPTGYLPDDYFGGSSRELVAPDYHELHWTGESRHGTKVANGVYFGVISVTDFNGLRRQEHTFTMVKAE